MEKISSIPKLGSRPADSHKGDYGKVLVIAGSAGMSGAAVLTAGAALRSGAGLVRLAVPKSIWAIAAGMNPCYTTIGLDDENGYLSSSAVNRVLEAVGDNDVVAIGPGMGVGTGQSEILRALIKKADVKIVADAAALENLSRMSDWCDKCCAKMVITPHPGEMKKLWQGLFREPMPGGRIEQAEAMAQKTGTVTVLKGAGTVISDGKRYYVNETGNPGMATGGSGDVLTGVIAALIGQGMDEFDAAVLAVHVHGLAGDIAAFKKSEVSLIATDILEHLCDAFKQITLS